MTEIVDFPKRTHLKRLDEIDWHNAKASEAVDWDMELGKPFGDINVPLPKEPERYSPAAKILHETASLIDGDRHVSHGDRHVNFGTIAAFWTVLFGIDIQPWQVARAFELAKIARDINGEPNEDNAKDGAGYSALSWELRNGG